MLDTNAEQDSNVKENNEISQNDEISQNEKNFDVEGNDEEPENNDGETSTKEENDLADLNGGKPKKGMRKIKIALGLKKKTVIDVDQA